MSAPSFPYVVVGGDPRYVERLQRNKDIVTRLCAVLHEYLSAPIDAALEQASQKPPRMPRPTIDDLNRAQEDLDLAESQLAGMEGMAAEMTDSMAANFKISQTPTIQRMIRQLRDRVSSIQRAIEEPEDSPWDGSHHISTLCAVCAANFPGYECSIPALKISLKAAGWGRDTDGDHICPACAAKATAQPESCVCGVSLPGSNPCCPVHRAESAPTAQPEASPEASGMAQPKEETCSCPSPRVIDDACPLHRHFKGGRV